MRESTYASVAMGLGIAVVLDAVPVHLLLRGHPVLQAVLLAVHLYAIVWLVGDLRLLREATCRFERSAFVIDLGVRGAARVPFHAIAAASACEPDRPPAKDEARLTPGDPPNVLLRLAKAIVVRRVFGVRHRVRTVRLYVDEPARFIARLADRK